jgi:hypothetical protein
MKSWMTVRSVPLSEVLQSNFAKFQNNELSLQTQKIRQKTKQIQKN